MLKEGPYKEDGRNDDFDPSCRPPCLLSDGKSLGNRVPAAVHAMMELAFRVLYTPAQRGL